MPQDGSNNYQYPPGTPGIPDTTIESEAYNTFLDDLVLNDLNIPRPVHRGGTGASTADAALVNLKAEKAEQVVTAYLSHVWMPGSFRSAIGATDAPVAGHAFAGICYINEPLVSPPTNANVTVEARDQSDTVVPGKKYIRQKIAGVWGAWAYEDQDVIDYAAPFDAAMAHSGMQINGSMDVSQEFGVAGTSLTGKYPVDGWRYDFSGTGVCSAAQYNGGPSGIYRLLGVIVTTTQPTMSAANYYVLSQTIEGYRISRLAWGTAAARPITIGFWTAHTLTGVYTATIRNSVSDRGYAFSYTQLASGVWEYRTVTIPGCTDGAWNTNNLGGVTLCFAMACGSTSTAPSLNSWLNGNYLAGPGQTNGMAGSNIFRLTGVIVLPGSQAPTATQSPLIMRPYDQELATCQRYYQWLPFDMYFIAANASQQGGHAVTFPVTMRANPTIGAAGADPNTTQVGINSSGSYFGYATPYGAMAIGAAVNPGAFQVSGYRCSADARL